MERIVVLGAGGFGRETLDVIQAINSARPRWEIVGVIDDAPASVQLDRLEARGVPWLGALDTFLGSSAEPVWFTVAVGSPTARRRLHARLEGAGHRPATLVHPAAHVGSQVSLAPGTIVCGGAQISTNVTIGVGGHVNPNATVGHDSTLDDWVSINPAAVVSGDVTIGATSLVGAGAVILQGLSIGEGALVGAAACVTRSVESGRMVKGIPAR
ncbi:acetyltransferase [Agrococcus sp. TSP3-2-1]|uniref:acetyltransferase n=1 Tax=Agrococcus sp. TSP3-2-1 TaxID=2804583 RepID=UPI003CEFDFDD